MLTEAKMQQMYEEDKLLARGLDPDYTPLQEEADSFQYAQETELPQAKPGHGGGGTGEEACHEKNLLHHCRISFHLQYDAAKIT